MPRTCHYGTLTRSTARLLSTNTSSSLPSKVIFSGIQPTGIPHLGNYLGALRQWTQLQTTNHPTSDQTSDTSSSIPLHSSQANPPPTLLFCVVDLHALTLKQNPTQLRTWKRETLATLLAIGLDPARSILFHQSDVAAHAELHWLLSCSASMGYLSRMTQWKSKLEQLSGGAEVGGKGDGDIEGGRGEEVSPLSVLARQKLKLGLFSYPVLQAADILVHGATHVPVGEDQVQHIEFARECAGNFNALYGSGQDILVKPEVMLSPAKRIMSLKEPKVKMSKSAADQGSRILLTDEPEVIRRKIKTALTDSVDGVSYDVERRPGVSNLIEILVYLGRVPGVGREDVVRDLQGVSLKGLKERVADEIEAEIGGIRERIKSFLSNGKEVDDIAAEGAVKARESAAVTLGKVREAIGLD